jgi:hypothetical protein
VIDSNPKGVASLIIDVETRPAATLSGLEPLSLAFPKVAEYSNLGLVDATPFGVAVLGELGASTAIKRKPQHGCVSVPHISLVPFDVVPA